MTEEKVLQRYQKIMRRIETRLDNSETTSEQSKELRTIKARMQIMGPAFLGSAGITKLRAMFDGDFL